MKKKLILVASPPACGKTYISNLIAEQVGHIVYLDKDDLSDIVRAAFKVADQELNMDGDFYKNNLRSAEYSTILHIAFSTLRFEDKVLLNAPLGNEIRNTEYMKSLKQKANKMGAELVLIWVSAPTEVCYERMKKRNCDRDVLKLQNWEDYVKKINYNPPYELKEANAVDKFILFDTSDDLAVKTNLKTTVDIILGE